MKHRRPRVWLPPGLRGHPCAWSVRYDPALSSGGGGGSPTAGATIFWDLVTQDTNGVGITVIGYNVYRGAGLVSFGSCSPYWMETLGPDSSQFTDPAPLAGNATYFVTAERDTGEESSASGPIYKSN